MITDKENKMLFVAYVIVTLAIIMDCLGWPWVI